VVNRLDAVLSGSKAVVRRDYYKDWPSEQHEHVDQRRERMANLYGHKHSDSKMWHSLLSYHSRIGYTYTPNIKTRVPFETGGYLVRTNSSGFRSAYEFVKESAPNSCRAILFGDSMVAGDGVSNNERFSDLLEKGIPDLEIFNYGLAGSGTDQAYLTYIDFGAVDHELIIIGIWVGDITRVNSRYLTFYDANGQKVFYAKPYFVIESGELVLKNVPVQKRPWTVETIPDEEAGHIDGNRRMMSLAQDLLGKFVPIQSLRLLAQKSGMSDILQAATRLNRVPEYDAADNPAWLLLSKLLETWIQGAQAPVLVVPIPMWVHVEGTSDATGYQARFRELAAKTGCFLHDPLPDLLAYDSKQRRNFRFKQDIHLSPNGHRAMAKSLAPAVDQIIQKIRYKN
jgi:hypothetical protein